MNNLKIYWFYNEDIKKNIKIKMWSNYGKTFVEYLFFKKFKKIIHILN